MKQIIVTITGIQNVSTIQMKYNNHFVVENVTWRRKPRFPFRGLLKAALRIWKLNMQKGAA